MAPSKTPPPASGRPSWLDRISGRAAKITIIVGAISAVVALWPGELWNRTFAKPQVSVAQNELSNPAPPTYAADEDLPSTPPDLTPKIAVTLANSGGKDLRIDRITAQVEDYAGFGACSTGSGSGDVPSSSPVALHLDGMLDPRPSAPVGKVIAAGDTHRFAVELEQEDRVRVTALYALRVTLQTDDKPIELGRYVVAMPQGLRKLDAEVFPISARSRPLYGDRFTAADTWCYRSQWNALQRLLARPGQRSAETRRLAAARASKGWKQLADQTPPRQAVDRLLAGDSAQYAIAAARQAGDPELEAQTIEQLSAKATEQLETRPAYAAFLAEAVYEAVPTKAHRALVDQARLMADSETP